MKFTKTYNVQPNAAQKAAMTRAFNVEVVGALTEGSEVEVLVNSFEAAKIQVSILINKVVSTSRVIGSKGGLVVL